MSAPASTPPAAAPAPVAVAEESSLFSADSVPKSFESWVWWINIVLTVVIIITLAIAAFQLRGPCLTKISGGVAIPLISFGIMQLVAYLITPYIEEQEAAKTAAKLNEVKNSEAAAVAAAALAVVTANKAAADKLRLSCAGDAECLARINAELAKYDGDEAGKTLWLQDQQVLADAGAAEAVAEDEANPGEGAPLVTTMEGVASKSAASAAAAKAALLTQGNGKKL